MSRYQDAIIEDWNYASDRRVQALDRVVAGFDEKTMTITFVSEECDCDEHSALMHPFWTSTVQADDDYAWRKTWWRETRPGWVAGEFFVSLGPTPIERRIHDAVIKAGYEDRASGNRLRCTSEADAREVYEAMIVAGGYEDEPDLTHVWVLRAQFAVCPTCDGKGSHVNPSIDCNGIGADDEFWDDDYDEETGESRYHNGYYDVPCYECKGKRVVPVPVDDGSAAYKRWVELEQDRAYAAAERAAERRYGY